MFLSDSLSFLGSNNQKQSVVRRCSNMLAHTFTAPKSKYGVSAAYAAIFSLGISKKQVLASTIY